MSGDATSVGDQQESWRDTIRRWHPAAVFRAPVSAAQLVEAEQRLGLRFPQERRSFLLETDGAIDDFHLAWTLDRIVEEREEQCKVEAYP